MVKCPWLYTLILKVLKSAQSPPIADSGINNPRCTGVTPPQIHDNNEFCFVCDWVLIGAASDESLGSFSFVS